MFPTGSPAPLFCCSIFCQENLLLWAINGRLMKIFALEVKDLLQGGAQHYNPSPCHLGQCMFTCGTHHKSPYSSCMGYMPRVYLPWKQDSKGSSHADACWISLQYETVCSQRAQPDLGIWKHSRFTYTVRALLSEGQKLSHWQQETPRQEVWRQPEWGVWVQTLPCPSCSFPAAMKGSQRTMSTLPYFKKLAWNNYIESPSSLYSTRTQRKISGLIKEVEQHSHMWCTDKEPAT